MKLKKGNLGLSKFVQLCVDGCGLFARAYSSWTVGVITDNTILEQAYRLRGLVFGEKLKWIAANGQSGDTDKYDGAAVHFGITEEHKLIAYSRLIPGRAPFMIEQEFQCLVPGVPVRKGDDTAEISRLVIDDAYRGSLKGEMLKNFLYRAMLRWAIANGIRYWYIVVTPRYLSKLANYYGFRQIGEPYCFESGGGVVAVAALVDLRNGLAHLRSKNWLVWKWYCGFFGSTSRRSRLSFSR